MNSQDETCRRFTICDFPSSRNGSPRTCTVSFMDEDDEFDLLADFETEYRPPWMDRGKRKQSLRQQQWDAEWDAWAEAELEKGHSFARAEPEKVQSKDKAKKLGKNCSRTKTGLHWPGRTSPRIVSFVLSGSALVSAFGKCRDSKNSNFWWACTGKYHRLETHGWFSACTKVPNRTHVAKTVYN